MLKLGFYIFLLLLLTVSGSYANYNTPGTGVRWTLDELITNSGGVVTLNSGVYHVNDTLTISTNDTLLIVNNSVVKYAVNTFLGVNGVLIVNPPTSVTFTAMNPALGFYGLRVEGSNATTLRKLTLEYAVSLRLNDCSIGIDSCLFQYNNNNPSATFGNGAISLFKASPVITNCRFINNNRAAIQGAENIANAPKIINCVFVGNNTSNTNIPQINLGATGNDTAKIVNNQILRASTNSGGIGLLPIGNAHVVITGNVIKNNRYGISLTGGSNINAMISYNVIDSNNTGGNPFSGGSGIAFSGGSSSSHQNVIVTGNLIRWNFWGVTISATSTGGGAKPNLGNIINADTSDDGKNHFINNTNSSTPNIDVYNSTADNIFAQNNYWGTNDLQEVEAKIFHKPDNSAFGSADYNSFILPIELSSFTAAANTNSNILLNWQTSFENNSDHFRIERSDNGQTFISIGKVPAAGTPSSAKEYSFTDNSTFIKSEVYYRLRLVDKDNKFRYSPTVSVKLTNAKAPQVRVFPTIIAAAGQSLQAEVTSEKNQPVTIQFVNGVGKQLSQTVKNIVPGNNRFILNASSDLPDGWIYIRFTAEGIDETIRLFKVR